MKYKVTIGNDNSPAEYHEPGELVRFRIPFMTDVNTNVSCRGAHLKQEETDGFVGSYSFIMPEGDVLVQITHSGGMLQTERPISPMMAMMNGMGMANYREMLQNSPGEDFGSCPDCGAPLIKKGQKFCQNCGSRLNESDQK